MAARLDPLGATRQRHPELTLKYHGFAPEHLDLPFSARAIGGDNVQTLRTIVRRLRNTYCRSIGVQFMHIDDLTVRDWLQERMEGTREPRSTLIARASSCASSRG